VPSSSGFSPRNYNKVGGGGVNLSQSYYPVTNVKTRPSHCPPSPHWLRLWCNHHDCKATTYIFRQAHGAICLLALSTGSHLFTPGRVVVLISVRVSGDPRAIVWPEGLYQFYISITTLEIYTTVFWLVAWCLNQGTVCSLMTQFNTKFFNILTNISVLCHTTSGWQLSVTGNIIVIALVARTHMSTYISWSTDLSQSVSSDHKRMMLHLNWCKLLIRVQHHMQKCIAVTVDDQTWLHIIFRN
jgi:hypothetical protein